MNSKDILELMAEVNEEAVVWTGFDDAIIGIMSRFSAPEVLLYDWQKCVDILIEGGCEDREEAEEYLHFNVLGGWVGEGTPAFANMFGELDIPSSTTEESNAIESQWRPT